MLELREQALANSGPWGRPFPLRWLVACAQHDGLGVGLAIWFCGTRETIVEMTLPEFMAWTKSASTVLPGLKRLRAAGLLRYTVVDGVVFKVTPYFDAIAV